MKRFIILSILIMFSFVACNFDTTSNNSTQITNSSSETQETGTRIKFLNKTDYLVKVYSDPLRQTLLGVIGVNENRTFNADYSRMGTPFYLDYYLVINNLKIKYGEGTSQLQLKENELMSADIPTLKNAYNNYTVIGIRNLSKSAIELMQSNKICFRDDGTSLLNENDIDYFLFSGEIESSLLKISDAESFYNFSDSLAFEKSTIYSFDYSGNGQLSLTSKVSFNPSINSKIWKMPLSQTIGKYLTADRFAPRENVSDGYFFTGQISYNNDYRNEESVPYKAEISPLGEISDSVVILNDNPKMVWSRIFNESNGYRIVAGIKANENDETEPFIYGDKGCDFYTVPEINDFYNFDNIQYKEGKTFSLLYDIISADDEEKLVGFGIYELEVKSYDEVKGKVVYTNTEEKYEAYSFVYNDGKYYVLANIDSDNNGKYDSSSFLTLVSSTEGVYEIQGEHNFKNYSFSNLVISEDKKSAVAVGSYLSNRTNKESASFVEIDLDTGNAVGNENPKLFEPRDSSKNSCFNSVSIIKNEIILAGAIDFDDDEADIVEGSGYPYIISYDLTTKKQKWSHIYEDFKGYQVFSCYLSAIGTPLIEIYNNTTGRSYLASCGLLGEIPEKTLDPLPRSSKISNVEKPRIQITVVDSEAREFNISIPYETELTFDELLENLSDSFSIPEGKDIDSWQVEEDGSWETVNFPITITEQIKLFPVFGISVPKNLEIDTTVSPWKVVWDNCVGAEAYNIYLTFTESYYFDDTLLFSKGSEYNYVSLDNSWDVLDALWVYPGVKFNISVSSVDSFNKESRKSNGVSIEIPLPQIAISGNVGSELDSSRLYGKKYMRIYVSYDGDDVGDIGNQIILYIFRRINGYFDTDTPNYFKGPKSFKKGDRHCIDIDLNSFGYVYENGCPAYGLDTLYFDPYEPCCFYEVYLF